MKKRKDILEKDFEDQLELMRNSIRNYDEGSMVEYKNLATRLRVLLYDSKSSKNNLSLFTRLNLKEGKKFVDTCLPYISNEVKISWYGLVAHHSAFNDMVPICGEFPETVTLVNFEQWWTKPVLKDMLGNSLTREQIIMTVANKDGGAHVDQHYDETKDFSYIAMEFQKSLGVMHSGNGEDWEEARVIPATIRQISAEILKTADTDFEFSKYYSNREGIITSGIKITVEPSQASGELGRNDPCACGSGVKYKKCCLPKRLE